MDLGESINPAIDIGQVEGAFVQGYGLFMMEQILHTPTGVLLTRGPGAYKIPSFNDIPGKFRSQSFGSVLSHDSSAHPELTRERSIQFLLFEIRISHSYSLTRYGHKAPRTNQSEKHSVSFI